MNAEQIVWIDTETTGLGDGCLPWEVACIDHDGRVFHRAWVPSRSAVWEPQALVVNRYVDRYEEGSIDKTLSVPSVRADLYHWMQETPQADDSLRVLAGSNPTFDRHQLDLIRGITDYNLRLSHRTLDVPTFAAGILGGWGPVGLNTIAKQVCLDMDPFLAHGALYDCWVAREVYQRACEMRGDLPDGWVHMTYDECVDRAAVTA